MRFLLKCSLFGVLAFPLSAQNANIFSTQASVSIAANATTTLTIQQPATGAKQVQLWRATVSCDTNAFTIDQKANGTAATATAATVTPNSPILGNPSPTPSVTAWSGSNVGSGTAIWATLPFTGGPAVLDLSSITMLQTGTGTNYSIVVTNTGSGSCTAKTTIQWREGDLLNGATQSIP